MKNILLIGASSSLAKALYNKHMNKYNFIRLSRNSQDSDFLDFNVLDLDTYPNNEMRYDGLVYFPGSINLKPFKNLKVEDFYNDFEINVIGIINSLKFYMPYLNKECSIIFVSSLAAKIGMPFHSSISAAKSAILGLSRSLAAEFAPNFRVNSISPSLFESKMSSRFLKNEKARERIQNNNPLKTIGNPQDISSLIDFLLSSDSKWITGQDISIDGGMSTLRI